jgi:NAD(P)-dependent dehydrogenase (short-subunit alcohol dehydrogenase family)
MGEQKVAVVTGVSSGIGEATAQAIAAEGYRVFGTVRSPSATVPQGVERSVLDVRDEASIAAAVSSILKNAGRIDVLVNNAGATILGAIEETDTEQAKDLFDVNFFGVVRVTRAVLPTMRAQRSGRILSVSSIVGFLPAPFMGFYAASKHALEGYSETLDHEVRSFGVRSILIEPGYMRTKIDKNAVQSKTTIGDYATVRERAVASINANIEQGGDPSIVAHTVIEALRAPRPKLRYQVGKNAGTLAVLRSYLPGGMFDRALRKELKLDQGG